MGAEDILLSPQVDTAHRPDLGLGKLLSRYPISAEYGLPTLGSADDVVQLCYRLAPPQARNSSLTDLLDRHHQYDPMHLGGNTEEPYCWDADVRAGRGWQHILKQGKLAKHTVVEMLDVRRYIRFRDTISVSVAQTQATVRFKFNTGDDHLVGEPTGITLIGEGAFIVSPVVIAVYTDGPKVHFIYDIGRPRRLSEHGDLEKASGFVWLVRLASFTSNDLKLLF